MADTESLCPVCLVKIPAQRTIRDDGVYLIKECPAHGRFKALLWRDAELYETWARGSEHARPINRGREGTPDCPYNCGLCSEHEGDTCTAVFHLTDACNMACPICFADAHDHSANNVTLDAVRRTYEACLERGNAPSVQLSGGEVTIREDLPDIIQMGKDLGVQHIQVNTNGLRVAREPEYLARLRESGVDLIYLQFDGTTDDVYRTMRGRDLMEVKLQALQHCRDVGIGVLLVPTIMPGVNDRQLGDIVALAKEWMPVVKGIHFQPVSYFGRFPGEPPRDEDHITLPDVLKGLEAQTAGEVAMDAMVPRRKFDAHCAFSSVFLLGEDGKLHPTTGRDEIFEPVIMENGHDPFASQTITFTNRFWRMGKVDPCGGQCSPLSRVATRLKNYTLSITGMSFQDVWNIDLQRLKGCCVHVATPQGERIPLCAYYLTSATGRRLYGEAREPG